MTPNELKAALEADGWNFSPQPFKSTGVDWYAWRKLDGAADCTSNEKPPCLILKPWEIERQGDTPYQSVEFEVAGEVNGNQWLSMKVYSVSMDETFSVLPRAAEILLIAWNAAALRRLSPKRYRRSGNGGNKMPETPAPQRHPFRSVGDSRVCWDCDKRQSDPIHLSDDVMDDRFVPFVPAGEQEDSGLPRTKPWKEHLRERLTTTEDITGYLSACHDEGPEVFRLGIKDVLEFARTPSVSPSEALVQLHERVLDQWTVACNTNSNILQRDKFEFQPLATLLFDVMQVLPTKWDKPPPEEIAREIVTASFGSMPDPNAPAGWRVKLTNRIAAALRSRQASQPADHIRVEDAARICEGLVTFSPEHEKYVPADGSPCGWCDGLEAAAAAIRQASSQPAELEKSNEG